MEELNNKKENFLKSGLYAVIASGILIALFTIINNRSLWVDEAMLALNVVSRSYSELLQPMEYIQIAPIAFLYVEKTFTLLFGNDDYALRIFPFICFLVAMPLLFSLTKKLTDSKWVALLSVAAYSINYRLIYYSSEVKQYAVDVLICLLILFTALHYLQNRNSSKAMLKYLLVGVVVVWFSNVSIVLLFTVGAYLGYEFILKDRNFKVVIPIGASVLSFATYYLLFVHSHPSRDLQVVYWASREYAFMPLNPFSAEFWAFALAAFKLVFGKLMVFEQFWIAPAIVIFSGAFFLVKNKKIEILYLLLSPVLLHLALSGLKLYPFDIRLVLYNTPLFIILFMYGCIGLWKIIDQKLSNKLPLSVLLVAVLLFFYPLSKKMPIENEEVKQSLKYISEHYEKNDDIYVHYFAEPAYRFYKDKYKGVSEIHPVMNIKDFDDWSKYDSELLSLKTSAWLLFSHVIPAENNYDSYILDVLKKNSFTIVDEQHFSGSTIYKVSKK